ncbi:MAG: hypothetical protein ACE5IH_00220 [Thermodesulfobacteriota bacterium]
MQKTSTSSMQKKVPEEVKRIAILPFDNTSGRRDAGKIVANIFNSEFIKNQTFEVVEPGNINKFLIEEGVINIGEIDIQRLRLLGKRFGIDAVIVGTVEEFYDGIKGTVPVVSITARMVRTDDGIILWPAYKKKRGDDSMVPFDFGKIRSVTSLTQSIVKDMLEEIR